MSNILKAQGLQFKQYSNLVNDEDMFQKFALVVGQQIEANLK